MELRHLRYFVAVANEQNFTRAAELLNVAQPPLSRQIRQLEEEIGADLFDRDSRPVRLTEAGRLLYEHAVPLLAGVDQLRDMMRRFTGHGQRRFVIGFVGSILFGPLPEVIRLFRDRATNVEVSVLECTTTEQIAALKEGRIDAGFGRLRFEDPAIRRIVLAEEKLLAAVPADHPLALARRPVHLEDLVGQTLIAYPRPARPSYADQVFSIFHDAGLQPSGVQEVRELQTAIGLVAAHAGFTIVPESVQRFRRDDVAYLPIADNTARSPIMMIHRMGDISAELAQLIAISRDVHGVPRD